MAITSYTDLEEKIRSLPEECLEEVSRFVESVLFRYKHRKPEKQNSGFISFFGVLENLPDGLDAQRRLRDEWD